MVAEVETHFQQASQDATDKVAEKGLHVLMDHASVSEAGIPEALWRKVSAVQLAGGAGTVQAAFLQLQKSAGECRDNLAKAADALQKEEADDKTVRDRFQGKWTRALSETLTTGLKQQMNTYTEKLQIATDTNKNVENKVAAVGDRVPLLMKSRAELEQIMPAGEEPGGAENPAAGQLRAAVSAVEAAKAKAWEAMQA